jgi:membrane protein YqaA with SNARE-associated domain
MPPSDQEYYQFITRNALRGILWFAIIIGLYLLFEHTVGEQAAEWMKPLTRYPLAVLSVFLASETFFGIIPLEFFVIWAVKKPFADFLMLLTALSLLSYLGGVIAYYLGYLARRIAFLKRILEKESFQEYRNLYRRYGGILILISALTPLPFATIAMISASLGFPFRRYLLYSLSRFLRFLIVGYFFLETGI